MLYNRVFRTVLAPGVFINYNYEYPSGFDEYSTAVTYNNVITITTSPAIPLAPPSPYTNWSAVLQTSPNDSTWTDTTLFATLSGGTVKIILTNTEMLPNYYYRVQVVLRNPSTGAIEERFSTSNSQQLTSFVLADYQVYGTARGITASTSSLTGIQMPIGANNFYGAIKSAGGDGVASNGVTYGGGGGGGRLASFGYSTTTPFEIYATWNISISTGPTGYCIIEDTYHGEYFKVKNGGAGSLGAAGLGSTSADDITSGYTANINDQDGPDGTTSTGNGNSSSLGPNVFATPSTGPNNSSDTALIAGYYGFGGNGVPLIYAGATPAPGSGGAVLLRFFKA
jgi:hypothetical protein